MNQVIPQIISLYKGNHKDVKTLKEAWDLSKKGYYFSPRLFSIEEQEWKEIASYPPIVPLEIYMEIRKNPLKKDDLMGKVKSEDVLFYLTRKFLPNDPYIEDKIDRLKRYPTLSDQTRKLFDKLYTSSGFKNANPIYYDLENWIFTFDEFMFDEQILLNLLYDMNEELPRGADPAVFVYQVLEKKIQEKSKKK